MRDARGEVTLLIPFRKSASAAISLLANAPGTTMGVLDHALPPAIALDRFARPDLGWSISSVSGRNEQARAAGEQFCARCPPPTGQLTFSSDVRKLP